MSRTLLKVLATVKVVHQQDRDGLHAASVHFVVGQCLPISLGGPNCQRVKLHDDLTSNVAQGRQSKLVRDYASSAWNQAQADGAGVRSSFTTGGDMVTSGVCC